MNRRSVILATGFMIVVLLLIGCGQEEVKSSVEKETLGSVSISGIDISLNEEIDDVISQIGEANKVEEFPSCLFDGMDKTFSYNQIIITTRPENESNLIESIRVVGKNVVTYHKITTKSTKEEIERAYGIDELTNQGKVLTYKKGNESISYSIVDDKVEWIEVYVDR